MVLGALLAFRQWDLKRLLAYSSISQIGYVVMSIGMALVIISRNGDKTIAALAIAGGLYHLINHAVFKGLLFLDAGSLEYRAQTRNLREMGGMAGSMPVTSSTSFIASMSISGLPPFNGFFSKLIIVIAAIQAGFFLLAALAIIVSIITLAYFLKFNRYAFFNKNPDPDSLFKEVPFTMMFTMITLGLMCFALSILAFPGIRDLLLKPAVDILMNSELYSITLTGT
jgi:multicomponent Na+:H+ antiporter subunit D